MSSSMYCLDIAVDHRIRRLCEPVPPHNNHTAGNHGGILRDIARSITRSPEAISAEEINFAVWLSEPATTGGLLIMLQQPADNHPYHLGNQVVVQSCGTLAGLDELLQVASCGTLSLKTVSVFDWLPYTRKRDKVSPDYETYLRGRVYNMICAKRPSVILCMSATRKGLDKNIERLTSCRIGRTFSNTMVHVSQDHTLRRVNAFHPSTALYWRSHESSLRQLLLLETAHACGELRGDWTENAWISSVRCACQVPTVPAVETHLQDNLDALVPDLVMLSKGRSLTRAALCQEMTRREMSKRCNDLNLCLRHVDSLVPLFSPDPPAEDVALLVSRAVHACACFIRRILSATKGRRHLIERKGAALPGVYGADNVGGILDDAFIDTPVPSLATNIKSVLQRMNDAFTVTYVDHRMQYSVALINLARLFLRMAATIEEELARPATSYTPASIGSGPTNTDIVVELASLRIGS